jgi:hypothetical protein
VNRRNLLRRHLKPTAKKLGLPETVDFRSFRTMHSSLMSSIGVRPEVTRLRQLRVQPSRESECSVPDQGGYGTSPQPNLKVHWLRISKLSPEIA